MSAAAVVPERPRGRRWIALACLLAAAFLLRAWIVVAPPVDIFERDEVNQEELLRGIAAQELLEGPVAPLFDYQVNHFWGGSLVASFVAVPFYALLGSRVVALRLVGVVFALLAVTCAFRLLDRFAGRTAAWIGAGLLALSPPGYTYLTCMVFGTHMESNALALALVWMWCAWRARERAGTLRTALFGALAGLCLWFGYGLLLVLGLIAVFEFVEDPWFWARRRALPWLAGFAVGFSPWILYGLERGFRGFDVYDAGILEHFVQGISKGTAVDMRGVVRYSLFEKAWMMLEVDYPQALWFHESLGITTLDLARAATLGLVATVLAVGWRVRRSAFAAFLHVVVRLFGGAGRADVRPAARDLGLFAFTFTALYFAAYVASDFAIGPRGWVLNFRYLMPIWPFVAICVGIGLAHLVREGRFVRWAAIGGLVLFLGLNTASAVDRCRPARIAENWERPGTSQLWFARLIVLHFGDSPEKMVRVVQNIEARRSPEVQAELLALVGRGLATYGKGEGTDKKSKARNVLYRRTLAALETSVRPEHRVFFAHVDR